MRVGQFIRTPRFGSVRIKAIFDNEAEARKAGFKEPTDYDVGDFNVYGRQLGFNRMDFAAYPKLSEVPTMPDIDESIEQTTKVEIIPDVPAAPFTPDEANPAPVTVPEAILQTTPNATQDDDRKPQDIGYKSLAQIELADAKNKIDELEAKLKKARKKAKRWKNKYTQLKKLCKQPGKLKKRSPKEAETEKS